MLWLNKIQRLIAIGHCWTFRCVTWHYHPFGNTLQSSWNCWWPSRSGRPWVMMPFQDHHIRTSHLRDRFLLTTSTAMVTPGHENNRISSQTVRNRLVDYGITARHPYHGLRLMPPRRRYRAHWAHQHRRWTQKQRITVLFNDESRFCLDSPDWRMRCYRRRGERYSDACVLERDRFGSPSVMVWMPFHSTDVLNLSAFRAIWQDTDIAARFCTCCGSIL